jgi:hypothetical protein
VVNVIETVVVVEIFYHPLSDPSNECSRMTMRVVVLAKSMVRLVIVDVVVVVVWISWKLIIASNSRITS